MRRKPNRNPRVHTTLTPEAHKVISDVSDMTGQTRSALVAEMVDMALPAMLSIRDALRVVKAAPEEAERIMQRFASAAIADAAQSQMELGEKLDQRTVKGKRAARAQRAESDGG